ncbi:MAG: glycosyl hydrolase, partial [Phycisphaerae bacterium]|nr:glycosyl hydrolase [Phycisphaerae bacterium]
MTATPPAGDSATRASIDRRVRDLLGRMTIEEKASLMLHDSPGAPRVGIPAYNWWNECLHGVGRAGRATVFPQPILTAATFDPDLVRRLGEVISLEARAKHHAALRENQRGRYFGLTFWTPNINIFRDPRWGRGHETYGEDPFLAGELGVAMVRGLQGSNPRFYRVAVCVKHFAVHSGPEHLRHEFDARVSPKDME